MKLHLNISVILPIYNGQTTIAKTLTSLLENKKYFRELIIIDDNSNDFSLKEIQTFFSKNKLPKKIIRHSANKGLAQSYNEAIKLCHGNHVVLLHQDVIIQKGAFKKLISPFLKKQKNIVATAHINLFPKKIWEKYNFWQKCYFSRMVNTLSPGLNGQFDCFLKEALLKVGLFDSYSYRTAGEDVDIKYKLESVGKIKQTDAKVVHLHSLDPKFNLHSYVFKHIQYADARGVLLRNNRIRTIKDFLSIFFREILVLGLFIPHINIIFLVLIILYSFYYTKLVFIFQKNKLLFILPFVNIYLLFVSLYFSVKGFLYGRQTI